MNQGHTSLAPYVGSADELYELLQAGHMVQEVKSARWAWGMLAAAVVGLAVPGSVGKLAWMACIYSGMNWFSVMVDYVARGWFMHMLSLRNHLAPPGQASDRLAAGSDNVASDVFGDKTPAVH